MANSIQAAEVGKQLNLNQSAGAIQLSTGTCMLYITDEFGSTNTFNCQIDSVLNRAFLITTGVEFPQPGNYKLQLYFNGQGKEYKSAVATLAVQPNLGP